MNRKLSISLLVLLFPLVAIACGDDGADLTKVTFMLDWTPNTNHAGIFIAKEKGYYKDAGIDINIVEPGAGGVDQVVGAGTADFGISVQENVVPARAEGIPVVSIAAVLQHNTSSLISLASDNIKSPKDLAGKTYGGFGGPLEIALIKKLATCDGGDADAIKFVEVGDVDYLIGMEQNKFDFAWIFDAWDGVRYKEIEKKAAHTIPFIQYTKCIPDWYTPVIITNEAMIKNNPETIRKFMEATAKGYADAMKSPDDSYDAILKNAPETDQALVKASAAYIKDKYVDSGRKWGTQDEAIWTAFVKFLKDSGITQKDIDVKAAYTNDYLPK